MVGGSVDMEAKAFAHAKHLQVVYAAGPSAPMQCVVVHVVIRGDNVVSELAQDDF